MSLTSTSQMVPLSFVITLNTDSIPILQIHCVSITETGFHSLIHPKHNTVPLSFFRSSVGSKVGTNIVFVGYGIFTSFSGILS